MQETFLCSKCGQPFSSNFPASVRYRLKKKGKVYCSKECALLKHGCTPYRDALSESSEISGYSSWSAMKNRCNNPNFIHYDRYGGRGITYDKRWESFTNFLKDMGEKPSPKHQLERVDNDKNYCKENCMWVTRKEQTRNRGGDRATRLYTYDGKTMCIKDWADYVGISPSSMRKRLDKGWPLEKAFSSEKHDKPNLYTYDGKTMTLTEWSEHLGVKKVTLSTRLRAGYPVDKVFNGEKFNRWTI